MEIPQELFDLYNETVDDFINKNFGVNCLLVYPTIEQECANCIYDSINRTSTNIYKSGGPIPFTAGICPWCDGVGLKYLDNNQSIKMRVYWNRKDWIKIGIPLNIPDGAIQTYGFMSDLPRVLQAQRLIANSDLNQINKWEYELFGEPVPHGFKKNRYFIAYWNRI